jgi:hypothetical protein
LRLLNISIDIDLLSRSAEYSKSDGFFIFAVYPYVGSA